MKNLFSRWRTLALGAGLSAVIIPPLSAADGSSSPWDEYLWQSYRLPAVAPAASNLVVELRAEIQKILDAGPLAPVRTVYADLEQDPYFMYWQGGRMVTTLSMAWPYLDKAQHETVKRYVRAELDDARRAPWNDKGFIPADNGARRELHSFNEPRGWDRYWGMWGKRKPVLGSLYGLWLYAYRTDDWEAIQSHYRDLSQFYLRKADQGDLYGTMGAHIAMARIARHFTDTAMSRFAISNAVSAFVTGTNFAAVEVATRKYWPERSEPRQRNLVYQGWMFLDLCPEVGRYLADQVKDEVLKRHNEGLKKYPLFWLREAAYWSRWTGDEGLGIPTELMGMLVPVERWVAGVPPQVLARYTRSAPVCVGDCYWLETLVYAIEATGKTEWDAVEP